MDSAVHLGLNQDAQWYTAAGVEQGMTPQPYQNAYDTAVAELTEIAATFEQLRARKNMIENVIHALEPFFPSSDRVVTEFSTDAAAGDQPVFAESNAAQQVEPPEGYSFTDVPSPLPDISETGGDPFQRRVKSGYRFKGFAMQRSF